MYLKKFSLIFVLLLVFSFFFLVNETKAANNFRCISAYGYTMQGEDCVKEINGEFVAVDKELTERLVGRILLQVEDLGKAWYLNPADGIRYYMADGSAAYDIMRYLGVGISNADLEKLQNNRYFSKQHMGKIFLQVEDLGQAYYVDFEGVPHYMKDGDAAYELMRFYSLGITNADLNKIQAFNLPGYQKYIFNNVELTYPENWYLDAMDRILIFSEEYFLDGELDYYPPNCNLIIDDSSSEYTLDQYYAIGVGDVAETFDEFSFISEDSYILNGIPARHVNYQVALETFYDDFDLDISELILDQYIMKKADNFYILSCGTELDEYYSYEEIFNTVAESLLIK